MAAAGAADDDETAPGLMGATMMAIWDGMLPPVLVLVSVPAAAACWNSVARASAVVGVVVATALEMINTIRKLVVVCSRRRAPLLIGARDTTVTYGAMAVLDRVDRRARFATMSAVRLVLKAGLLMLTEDGKISVNVTCSLPAG